MKAVMIDYSKIQMNKSHEQTNALSRINCKKKVIYGVPLTPMFDKYETNPTSKEPRMII